MRITEETLEQEIAITLKNRIGGEILSQVRSGRGKPDLILIKNNQKYVIELKIGGQIKFFDAITQGYQYANSVNADGLITIIYPEVSRRIIFGEEDLTATVNETEISCLVLSGLLNKHYARTTLVDFADDFINIIDNQQKYIDINLITSVIREAVEDLSHRISQFLEINNPIIDEVINKFELFLAISNEDKSDEEKNRKVAANLSSYLLVNQLLLYQLLTKPLQLEELKNVRSIIEINNYFNQVKKIDYRAIYHTDIINHIPNSSIGCINKIIYAIKKLDVDNIPHDLLGRLFHEFLPFETRKQLAAFYTKPIAAEILATIAIDNPEKKIFDIACGSGTLLVSSYRRKKTLKPSKTHKELIQEEIFGMDIMPFAAHLAALNLTLQDINQPTNELQIGIGNTLELEGKTKIQGQLQLFSNEKKQVDVDLNSDSGFKIPESIDIVIMNPPYTDRRRIDENMLGGKKNAFNKAQNYWAYFLKAADDLLTDKGRIAAVLPRLFLAGHYSQEVRNWLLENNRYSLKYIVKSGLDTSFSEDARFRDYLIVLDKGNTNKQTAIVYVNTKMSEVELGDASKIGERILSVAEGKDYQDEKIQVRWINQEEIKKHRKDLGRYVTFEKFDNAKVINEFLDLLAKKNPDLLTFDNKNQSEKIIRGFEPKPSGIYDSVFLVKENDERRIANSTLIINREDSNCVYCHRKGFKEEIKILKVNLVRGLRTPSYINSMNVTGKSDWVIVQRFKDLQKNIENFTDKKIDFGYLNRVIPERKAFLILSKRINLAAPGTSLISFYSKEPIVSVNTMYSIKLDRNYSKGLCLWFNSIIGITQFLANRMETEAAYCDLLLESLRDDFIIPSSQIIKNNQEIIDKFIDTTANEKMPSILDQLIDMNDNRLELDRLVLGILGFDKSEIEELIRSLYRAVESELRSLSGVTK